MAPMNCPDPVADHVFQGHPSGDKYAEAHGGIDVASGDGADPVSRADQSESEGEGDANDAHLVPRDHSGAAAEEHEDECAYQFSEVFFHGFLQSLFDS